jgi:hypothetical protein
MAPLRRCIWLSCTGCQISRILDNRRTKRAKTPFHVIPRGDLTNIGLERIYLPQTTISFVAQWSSSMIRALGEPGMRGVPGSIPGWALFNPPLSEFGSHLADNPKGYGLESSIWFNLRGMVYIWTGIFCPNNQRLKSFVSRQSFTRHMYVNLGITQREQTTCTSSHHEYYGRHNILVNP